MSIMKTVFFATSNKHKIKEVNELIKMDNLKLEIPNNFEIEEIGSTFEENANLKAMALFLQLKKEQNVFAEDSGLCIEVLNNEPGIYSKRYDSYKLGKKLTNTEKNNFILEIMKNEKNRKAFFVCNISYLSKEGIKKNFDGIIKGQIALDFDEKKGFTFGYDPIFLTDLGKRFSDLSIEEKNKISHRGIAFCKFKEFLIKEDL